MASIRTLPFQNSSILRVYSERENINISPDYQRNGGIWTKQKKELLIDSILNDYDIPKLYFHSLSLNQKKELNDTHDFAIIDGRQRIETIWDFIEGKFSISDEFEYFADPSQKLGGLTYSDLAKEYPRLKIRFDSYTLPITLVETEDLDLIEDMFSRLNEAVPLNASEKRNSLGGQMAKIICEVALNEFFTNKVKFNNNRYQHREVAARLLFLIYILKKEDKIVDTKKPYLDKMVKHYKDYPLDDPKPIEKETVSILASMNQVFSEKDFLLRSQASITLYFMLFKEAIENKRLDRISRKGIIDFYATLAENRKVAERDITEANYEYLEFERMSQQGTNDASSIRERTRIIGSYLGVI